MDKKPADKYTHLRAMFRLAGYLVWTKLVRPLGRGLACERRGFARTLSTFFGCERTGEAIALCDARDMWTPTEDSSTII